jgi:hypothetical protein
MSQPKALAAFACVWWGGQKLEVLATPYQEIGSAEYSLSLS